MEKDDEEKVRQGPPDEMIRRPDFRSDLKPDRSSETGRETLRDQILSLRKSEVEDTRVALRTIEAFLNAGRPSAVDSFIEQCLASARRARRKAARLELGSDGADLPDDAPEG